MADSAVPASEFPKPILGERKERYVERVLDHTHRMWVAPFKACGHEVPPMDAALETAVRRQAEAVWEVAEKLAEVRGVR